MSKYLEVLKSDGIKLDEKLTNNYFNVENVDPKGNIRALDPKGNVLIYTGFSNELWNLTYSETHALGGSERAVISLAKELSRDYSIVISGDVLEETVDINGNEIRFIHRFKLENPLYKIIIVSRYVSFFTIIFQFYD